MKICFNYLFRIVSGLALVVFVDNIERISSNTNLNTLKFQEKHQNNASVASFCSCRDECVLDDFARNIVLVKIGGSSITNKARKETINPDALEWFSHALSSEVAPFFKSSSSSSSSGSEKEEFTGASTGDNDDLCRCESGGTSAFVVVHGAGSFGHHTAKEFGLKGQTEPPFRKRDENNDNNNDNNKDNNGRKELDLTLQQQKQQRRNRVQGLAKTRVSVQALNRILVSTLIDEGGINAVGISPCFGIPEMEAHGGTINATSYLVSLIRDTLEAGLIPVLHGDACLYGKEGDVGILSGDVLMENIGKAAPWISHSVFITDVDGVFTADPRKDTNAQLVPLIEVDNSGEIILDDTNLTASESTHLHDVTGGLKTKLKSAAIIAASGKNVTIVKCGSENAKHALAGGNNISKATVLFIKKE